MLLDLDAYGGVGTDGSFPFFLKEIADALSPKIAVILCKQPRPALVLAGGLVMGPPCLNVEATVLALLISTQLSTLLFYLRY